MAILLAVSNRIRELRLERARTFPTLFTIAALASRVGVTEGMLRRWERGANRPTSRHVRALAKELGASVEELRIEDEAPERTKEGG